MDTMHQCGKIREESLYYKHKKHDGSLPLVGVNAFLPEDHGGNIVTEIELIRPTSSVPTCEPRPASPCYRRRP